MARKTERKKKEDKLDKLWRSVGKEEAHCEICASLPYSQRFHYSQLQPHHIIGRAHRATRWDLKNRLWVCPTHHILGIPRITVQNNLGGWFLNWESNNDWMGRHRPDDKEHLRYLADITRHWELEELEELIEQLQG